MPSTERTSPVQDSVPKVGGDVAVGEDLEFQRKWWIFERGVWICFLLLLICDVLGVFGRGWVANARRSTPDSAMTLDYERIERTSTPSEMVFKFGPPAIHNGHVQIFVSNSLVKDLGAQRVSPEPADSAAGDGGITYTFTATQAPASMQISLEPTLPGTKSFRVQLAGELPIEGRVFVVP